MNLQRKSYLFKQPCIPCSPSPTKRNSFRKKRKYNTAVSQKRIIIIIFFFWGGGEGGGVRFDFFPENSDYPFRQVKKEDRINSDRSLRIDVKKNDKASRNHPSPNLYANLGEIGANVQ